MINRADLLGATAEALSLHMLRGEPVGTSAADISRRYAGTVLDAAEAYAKSKWKPKPEPDTRPIQEPWPEETPA